MKKIILIVVILIGAIYVGSKFINFSGGHEKKSTVANSEIKDSPFQKEYLDKSGVVVVNVWATWCKPCLSEMPLFEKLIAENNDVKFVFISIDEDEQKLKEYLSENKINDITFANKNYIKSIRSFLGSGGVLEVIPETFIIKNGKVVDKSVGGIEYQEFKNKLQSFK